MCASVFPSKTKEFRTFHWTQGVSRTWLYVLSRSFFCGRNTLKSSNLVSGCSDRKRLWYIKFQIRTRWRFIVYVPISSIVFVEALLWLLADLLVSSVLAFLLSLVPVAAGSCLHVSQLSWCRWLISSTCLEMEWKTSHVQHQEATD